LLTRPAAFFDLTGSAIQQSRLELKGNPAEAESCFGEEVQHE